MVRLNLRTLKFSLLLSVVAAAFLLIMPSPAHAAPYICPDGSTIDANPSLPEEDKRAICESRQGGAPASGSASQSGVIKRPCTAGETPATTNCLSRVCEGLWQSPGKDCIGEYECPTNDLNECVKDNPIFKTILKFVNFLSAGVGIVVVIMIIVAGIQYSGAGGGSAMTRGGDSPQQTALAKKKIINALTALLAYIFLYAFLQWIVPGGLF